MNGEVDDWTLDMIRVIRLYQGSGYQELLSVEKMAETLLPDVLDADFESALISAVETTEASFSATVTAAPVDAVNIPQGGEEPATKKRKREVKPYEGTEEEFNLAWAKLKSLFHTHPAIFNEWSSSFTGKLVTLETKFGHDFFSRLTPKQKQSCVDEAVKLEKKLERLQSIAEDKSEDGDKKTSKGSKAKKVGVQSVTAEMFEKAWKAMVFMGNPLLSSVEYNFLANLGLRLREHKLKAVMAPYEQDLLLKILDSVPSRVALEKTITDKAE